MKSVYKKAISFDTNLIKKPPLSYQFKNENSSDEKNFPNLMIIDDDNEDVELLEEIVQSNGYNLNAKVFNDPFKGLKYLQIDHELAGEPLPDLIILDIYMVVTNGHHVLKEIKALEKTADIPVLMYSSSQEDADITKTYYNKSVGYFSKPLDFKEFYKCIKKALPDFPFPLEKKEDFMQLD